MRRRARRFAPLLAALALAATSATPGAAQLTQAEPVLHPGTPRAGDLWITGGRLFDAVADTLRPNPGILVRNGTLLALGVTADDLPGNLAVRPAEPGSPPVPEAAGRPILRHLCLSPDATVLPGFFDLHAHYAVDLFGEGRVDEVEVNPVVFLANGVTSTFPAGEVDPAAFDRAGPRLASGELPGPRIHRSGAYFGTARPGWDHEAMTPDSIRAEVRYWAGRGVRGFKAKGIRASQLSALIDEAHRAGLTVTAHLDSGARGSVNPRDAMAMGIDRVEHFLGGEALPATRSAYASLRSLELDDPGTREALRTQVRRFIEHDVHFDATVTAYDYFAGKDPAVYSYFADEMGLLTPYARRVVESRLPREPLEQFGEIYRVKQATVRFFVEEGGAHLLTVGTDHPSWGEFFSGFSIHRELHALSRAGIPNAVVLRAATLNPARALGLDGLLGSVEVGKLADLVVVRGDPIRDITVTRDVLHVIRAGDLFDPGALLDSVRGRLGPAGPEDADWWKGDLRLGGDG